MKPITPARVRFAPSPTGRFHIGGARTALYDYVLARQTGGQFILRIEDTDQKRVVAGAEDEIKLGLEWLGLDWDEGPDRGGPHAPYRQSERIELYQQRAEELIDLGMAYYCFCSPERLARVRQEQQKRKEPPHYDGLCRALDPEEAASRRKSGEASVIRFKTPKEGKTTAVDDLRGPIEVENRTIDDYVLVKSNGLPVYHLAAMVDDHEMGITHVLRGSEWLPTFPLHALIYQAFGWDQPVWVHLSVFLNPSGKGKLSKRHSESMKGAQAVFVTDMQQSGYLPEAVVNWIALMGWSYDDRREAFSLDDLVQLFSLEKLKPSPAAVNFSKLDHFNGMYIRLLDPDDLTRRIQPFFERAGIDADWDTLRRITPIIQERIRTLDEAVDMAGFFFRAEVSPAVERLVGKDITPEASIEAFRRAHDAIEQSPSMAQEVLEPALRNLADEMGLTAGQLFGMLRMAVTGQRVSPPLIESMEIIGRPEVLRRITEAADMLEAQSA